jgi:large subunit ribosomal protein L23
MKKIHYLDTIVCPLITEKATMLSDKNKVVFKVIKFSNKKILKKNIEKIFKVNVTKINTIDYKQKIKIVRGRKVKVPGYKKAIVTLKKGQSIDLTTGL